MPNEQARVYVNVKLLNDTKSSYPETKGMTYTGLVDWALRKLIVTKEKEASS